MLSYEFINTDEQLKNFCCRIKHSSLLSIDTEFVRTRTFTPILGLIQVYDGNHLGLIDTVSLEELTEFKELLQNQNIIKILHSCSEDLEAFKSHMGLMPQPVFDTQVAVSFLGMGNTIGYAAMIERFLSVKLDKGESRTDWISRPLSRKQLDYAAADVYYLLPAYDLVSKEISEKKLTTIVLSEIDLLSKKKSSQLPSDYAYLAVKNSWRLRGKPLKALQLIAKWRLERAKHKNLAINFVLKEHIMFSIAQKMPKDLARLASVGGLSPREISQIGEQILTMISLANEASDDDLPAPVERLIDFPLYKQALSDLKIITSKIAADLSIPIENVASKKQLNQWLQWVWFKTNETGMLGLKPDIISGWRRELFAESLDKLFSSQKGKYDALRGI